MKNLMEYKQLLNDFKFEILKERLLLLPFHEMDDILNQLAYDQKADETNLLVYTFVLTLIQENESAQYHLLASRLMGTNLNFINKAEVIGLYHGLKATELDPDNIEILEYLLYFNHIPERVLDDETAISFAKRILRENPDSLAARITLPK